ILDLLLDLLGLFLVDALLDGLRSALDQRLGLAEAEAGDRADLLDHVDLLAAVAGQDHVEFRLLFGRSRSSTAAAAQTPHFSSSCLPRSAPSRTVSSESWSTSLTMSAISNSLCGVVPQIVVR